MHHISRFGLVALLLLSLSGCTLGGSPVQPTVDADRTLRWSLEGISDLTALDPARPADHQSLTVINLVFAGLVRLDDRLQVQADGAERWTVSDDGRIYTFTLRETLAFGDGTSVRAEDFVYSINRALTPELSVYGARDFLKNIEGATAMAEGQATEVSGVRALDERRLEIRLSDPVAYFLSLLTFSHTFAVPRTRIERDGESWTERAIGSGPYRVRRWQHGSQIALEANPHYWRGTPGIATIDIRFFPNSDAAVDAYLDGELDIVGNIQSGISVARIGELANRADVRRSNALTVRYIGFNNRRPPFENLSVRQAFALAVDKRALAERTLNGTVRPSDRILPQGMPGSDRQIDGLTFDPVAARSALGLAGYVSGNTLPAITLTFAAESDTAQIAAHLRDNWRSTLGVNVELEELPLEQFIERLRATERTPEQGLQLYLSVWGADYPDPHNFLSLQLQSGSSFNNGHWSNEEFDRLTGEADQMSEMARQVERIQLYRDAEQIAIDQVGWLPLFNPQVAILLNPQLRGLSFTPQGIIASNWTAVGFAER
jgi:peptide/nickel transport system substrate-binding protein/oligopeptide transport system substrate-binding protein